MLILIVPTGNKPDVRNTHGALAGIHYDVLTIAEKKRLLRQKMKRGENTINFGVGDMVLWSDVDRRQPRNKLLVTWRGPFQITETIGTHLFVIKHLIDGTEHEVHAQRLKFYCDESLEVSEELAEFIMGQGSVLTVEAFLDHRWNTTSLIFELLVKWKGFSALEQSWEPLLTLFEDVPKLVDDYMKYVNEPEKSRMLETLPRIAELNSILSINCSEKKGSVDYSLASHGPQCG